jgi:hypothetical protein
MVSTSEILKNQYESHRDVHRLQPAHALTQGYKANTAMEREEMEQLTKSQ